ncbi:MAG: hypothetical protein Unbinned4098contig1000_17 [Prokaryotic dsDNA virus sp.]|nr:MAG: hypothetical protein Unbinned4098contig1000_17 [Prokaryotic dsDNA virus sp.]|tara:strand:- start:1352 stop:1552 length:201 start_codon:yes stop_codon:yes gene_type:complete
MTESSEERRRRKNAEYVKRYKASRERVEFFLPQGMRDKLRASVTGAGKHDSVQAWFLDKVKEIIKP